MDPKARRDFWDEIHGLADKGLTVLVSTHYMDEAERCHEIAYISYGRLIARGTADEVVKGSHLITFHGEGPDVGKLAHELEGKPGVETVAPFGAAVREQDRPPSPRGRHRPLAQAALALERGRADAGGRVHQADGPGGGQLRMKGFSLDRVAAVMIKEFKQLTRDRLTYAMMLGLPVIQLLLFGYAINTEPRHLPTAVLVQEDSVFARSMVSALAHSDYFDLAAQARSPAELDEMIRQGRVQFAVTIPGDFTRRVARGDPAGDNRAQILVEADATDPSATGGAVAALAALPAQALVHDLKGALQPRGQGLPPFDGGVPPATIPRPSPPTTSCRILLGIILSLTLVMMTALSVTRETERGTMESLLATPVQPLEVMVGKLAPYVGIGLVQTVLILLFARFLFGVPMEGGWVGLSLGVALFIVGSLALGFLISTAARSQLQAMQMSFFYIFPSILLSGFMFPFRGMPASASFLGQVINRSLPAGGARGAPEGPGPGRHLARVAGAPGLRRRGDGARHGPVSADAGLT